MSIIKELLLEADTLPKFDVNKYAPLIAHRPDNKWDKQALENFDAQLKAGKVYNPAFNEVKELWSRGLEKTLAAIYDKRGDDAARDLSRELYNLDYDIKSYISPNQASGQLKRIDAVMSRVSPELKKNLERAKVILQLGADLYKDLQALKPHVIAGRAPKPPDPNKFYNKMGGEEATKLVTDGLKKEIKEQMDKYETAIADYFLSMIDKVARAKTYSNKHADGSFVDVFFSKLFDFDKTESKQEEVEERGRKRNRHWTEFTGIKEKKTAKGLAVSEAKRMREGIETKFLAKSIQKLSNIVEKKGNLTKIKVIRSEPPNHNVVEAAFNFLFDDSSTFDVNNKVVWKWASKGQHSFGQYPTTFHNVKLPDGSKLGTPSEEKMVKEFATWKPK